MQEREARRRTESKAPRIILSEQQALAMRNLTFASLPASNALREGASINKS